jgi:hypothetical protein
MCIYSFFFIDLSTHEFGRHHSTYTSIMSSSAAHMASNTSELIYISIIFRTWPTRGQTSNLAYSNIKRTSTVSNWFLSVRDMRTYWCWGVLIRWSRRMNVSELWLIPRLPESDRTPISLRCLSKLDMRQSRLFNAWLRQEPCCRPFAKSGCFRKSLIQYDLTSCWTDDQEWELCLLNVALEPLYIHKEGAVDYVGDRDSS